MISDKLLDIARCPRCLANGAGDVALLRVENSDPDEIATLGLAAHDHDHDDHDDTTGAAVMTLVCQNCHRRYVVYSGSEANIRRGYLDLFESDSFAHHTHYLDDDFEQELDYQHIAPPLLGAAVRNQQLNKLLDFGKNDRVLEVGCGNGRFAYWNRRKVGQIVGVDAAPLFAEEALDGIDTVRGDARALPFADGAFDKLFTIDLMEHLDRTGIDETLTEMCRVLKPGGKLFIFSNTREKSSSRILQAIITGERRVGRFFAKRGVFDFKRDELRKSDHIKAIATHDELVEVLRTNGFAVERVVFWNGVFQALIDHIIIKFGEAWARRSVRQSITESVQESAAKKSPAPRSTAPVRFSLPDKDDLAIGVGAADSGKGSPEAQIDRLVGQQIASNAALDLTIRRRLKQTLSPTSPYFRALQALTWLQSLDLTLFGRVRSGVYFLVAKKV